MAEEAREAAADAGPRVASRAPASGRKKLVSGLALVVFVAFGVLHFGPRMPREMIVRFELPPTVRGAGLELPRARATGLTAAVFDADGRQVGSVKVGLSGASPRTAPSILQLRSGEYAFAVKIAGSPAGEIPMYGRAELSGGEVVVSLKAGEEPR